MDPYHYGRDMSVKQCLPLQ